MDQSDPFDSVLSSLVSSPQASDAGAFNGADCVMMTELIGRLGSIGNSGNRGTNDNNSTNSSCYVTPLNSPSKLNLSMTDPHIKLDFPIPIIPGNNFPSLVADPGFAERAARFSCFWGQNGQSLGLDGTQFSYRSIMPTSNQSSMLPTNQSLKASGKKFINRSSSPEFGDSREGSSLSEQIPCGESSGNRKRKSIPRGKAKETLSSTSAKTGKVGNEEAIAKRIKTADETFGNEKDTQKGKKENNSKPPEPPKDYIHVRARRGQATDSHSLAERVRREKISERMKYLQDLVPGCNKVTGKAVMLDEIINYVQSLQRQVEFLSMKLSTVNSRMDLNTEALLSKEVFQSHNYGVHSLDSSMTTSFPFGYHPQQVPNSTSSGGETQFLLNPYLNIAHHQNSGIQFPPMDGLTAQVPTLFEDDLQSLVQTSFGPTSHPSSNNCSD